MVRIWSRRHHVAVELAGVVGEVLVELLPALLAGQPVALATQKPASTVAALLGDPRADAVDVAVHVDAVGHGALRASTP